MNKELDKAIADCILNAGARWFDLPKALRKCIEQRDYFIDLTPELKDKFDQELLKILNPYV